MELIYFLILKESHSLWNFLVFKVCSQYNVAVNELCAYKSSLFCSETKTTGQSITQKPAKKDGLSRKRPRDQENSQSSDDGEPFTSKQSDIKKLLHSAKV